MIAEIQAAGQEAWPTMYGNIERDVVTSMLIVMNNNLPEATEARIAQEYPGNCSGHE